MAQQNLLVDLLCKIVPNKPNLLLYVNIFQVVPVKPVKNKQNITWIEYVKNSTLRETAVKAIP